MEKVSFFRVENNFTLWMNMVCSHSQVERVSFCLCSKKVMKENCLLWYRVNLRVSQTMLNHNQKLFLIVCYCSVCLHWRVCKSFWVAHLHNTARALSSPNRCFQLSTNFDKDFFRCLFNIVCQRGHSLALCRQGVLITPIQPTKSKSLFELINLIQI